MFQIRIHGRGGQGVVTAADLLAYAAFKEDRYAQAFPSFGSERTGAPACCRGELARPPRFNEDRPLLTRATHQKKRSKWICSKGTRCPTISISCKAWVMGGGPAK